MVRTTIACAWCRRSKIKCVHTGEPPCRNCLKSNRLTQCVLTGPFDTSRREKEARTLKSMHPVPIQKDPTEQRNPDTATASPQSVSGSDLQEESRTRSGPKDIVLATSSQIIIEVATIFNQKFPELAFLHLPTFSANWRDGPTNWVHIAAMLALCRRLLPPRAQSKLLTEVKYASYARGELQTVPSGPPNLSMVQALLTMSMYEWGTGNGYGAWMYSGIATRMMQSIDAMRSDRTCRVKDGELHNRTYWATFVMDRLIFCGKSQPLALPLNKMTIDMPLGEQDFAFGVSSTAGRTFNADSYTTPPGTFSINEYYWVLIRGFDIWSKVLDLIISGGRRQPNMSKPENCPWVPGSPWKTISDTLEEWRSQQSERLKFPATSVAVHVSLGYGEKFAFVNLLYYVSVLFLNREYIPFLPTQESEPKGPVDPPLLEAPAPPGWWHDRARDLFYAADSIPSILRQLEMLNTPLLTPFAGFCSFSAGTMNLYSASFPRMNLNRSQDAASNAEFNFRYLEKFKNIWMMGHGWNQTLKHAQNLYKRSIQDRARFRGKTRSDFTALEASIHDYSGVSPQTGDDETHGRAQDLAPLPPPNVQNEPDHTAALSLQELSNTAYQFPQTQEMLPLDMGMDTNITGNQQWDDVWPIWGEQQFLPFAVGGMPFDFSPNMPSFGNLEQ